MESVLKKIGFEHNEAVIYLFLLKKGQVSQQVISDETGILRQTVYDIMGKMEAKGYVSNSIISKHKVYAAVEPKAILGHIKDKEEQFIHAMPELDKIRFSEEFPLSSQTFLGEAGLKNLFSLTLESKKEILWMTNKRLSDQIFHGFYWHNYAKKRIKKRIPIKLLIEPKSTKDWDTNRKEWRQTKRHPICENLSSSFVLFDDKTLIYSQVKGRLQGVLIQNKSIKETYEKIFFELWKTSK